jgi:hypothetical protein
VAARRLIAVLLVLLAASVVVAAIAPDRRSPLGIDGEEETQSEEEAAAEAPKPGPPSASGERVARTLRASAERPPTIRADPGDQLSLSVAVRAPTELEIVPLGRLETASADDPALFELLLREPGRLSVTDAESEQVLGRVAVGPLTDEEPAAEPGEEDERRGERPGSR